MIDPDAMWKPGYVAPDDLPSEVRFDDATDASSRSSPDSNNRLRVTLTVVAVVAALVVMAAAVVEPWATPDADRPDVGLIGAADERRLPTAVEELWTTRLPGTGSAVATNLVVDGRDVVIAVVDDGSRDRAGVIALDALTGDIRWRRSFAFSPPEVRIVGVIDDQLVIEQVSVSSRSLRALATVDGSTTWENGRSVAAFNVVLEGTKVIAQIFPGGDAQGGSDVGSSSAIFVDPATGTDLGTVIGRPLSTDLSGTWFFGDRNSIVSIDLTVGWTAPVVVSEVGLGIDDRFGVVDERFIVVTERGGIAEMRRGVDDIGAASEVLAPLADPDAGDVPRFTSVFPSGGSRFVGVGDGVVVGAELGADDIDTRWKMQASMRNFAVTRRGLVLTLSEAGAGFADGVDLVVVDAVTGDRLAASGPAPDVDSLPLIVGDGFVITRTEVVGTDVSTERVGFDLDGTELWRLPATGTLRVGDRLAVTMQNTPNGFEVTAFGSSE